MLVLVCALGGPGSAQAAADDMFGMMFRMMLTMMNVMSDAMLDNNTGWGNNNWGDNFGLGGMNTFNAGMGSWPMMSGLTSPFSTFGYSPFNTFGMSPWSGMSPWTGMSPWSLGGNPWSGLPGAGIPGGWPGTGPAPFSNSNYGYPPNPRRVAPGNWSRGNLPYSTSLLEGRWYGSSGEILEIRGNRFRLKQGRVVLNGAITLDHDIVTMYSPQTNSATRYTFMRNQSGLLLQDASGNLLRFTNRPVNGILHYF
jgi:hypothetical protein